MNFKLRLKNKATLAALISVIVSGIYQILAILDFVPAISEDCLNEAVALVLTVLTGLGVLVDPTTAGIGDSERAMSYDKPRKDV